MTGEKLSQRLPWTIAFLTTLCLLVSYFGEYSWVLELFTHFKHLYALVLCLALASFVIQKNWMATLVYFPVFWLAALPMTPYLPYGSGAKHEGTPLRIALVNLNYDNTSYGKLLKEVEEHQPDVLILNEFTPLWRQNTLELDKLYPYRGLNDQADPFGIAIFSRYELHNLEVVGFYDKRVPSLVSDLNIEGTLIKLVASHPVPPVSEDSANARNSQLSAISDYLHSVNAPKIVVGDLNTTPWSPVFQRLLNKGKLQDSSKTRGIFSSWPAFFPLRLPLDHILHSKEFKVNYKTLGDSIDSDHLPVIVDLVLQSQNGTV